MESRQITYIDKKGKPILVITERLAEPLRGLDLHSHYWATDTDSYPGWGYLCVSDFHLCQSTCKVEVADSFLADDILRSLGDKVGQMASRLSDWEVRRMRQQKRARWKIINEGIGPLRIKQQVSLLEGE